MERVVNLRPDDSSQTLGALLLPFCLQASRIWIKFLEQLYRKWNVEWNVQIQQAGHVFSSSFVQNRSEKRSLEWLFSASWLACLLSCQHKLCRREKCLLIYSVFHFRLYRWYTFSSVVLSLFCFDVIWPFYACLLLCFSILLFPKLFLKHWLA